MAERLVQGLAINLIVESSVAFHTVTVEHTLCCLPVSKVPRVAQAHLSLQYWSFIAAFMSWQNGDLDTLPSW